jgi:hypothetical protein
MEVFLPWKFFSHGGFSPKEVFPPCVKYFQYSASPPTSPVAKFIVPDWGDKVDSDIGLSYRPARIRT